MSDAKSSEAKLFLAFGKKKTKNKYIFKGPEQDVSQNMKPSNGSGPQGGTIVGCRWTSRVPVDSTDHRIKVLVSFQRSVIPMLFCLVKAARRA